jgi:CubicO group peptidase (beta-lactamase class C family)
VRTLGLILLWIALVVGAVFAEAFFIGPPRIARGDFAAMERHLVEKLRDADIGSAALVLVQRGRIAATHTFGVAKPDPERSLFQLASVSKAVTAWGVMRLVEEGRIGLDEPVMRHLKRWRFPGSEAHRDKVTPRQLLSHTAGLDDGLGYGGFPADGRAQTLVESLTLTRDSNVGPPQPITIAREPGQAMAYSSAGYAVLQLLIEDVTGQPFETYMQTAVLRPLGMTRSTFDFDTAAKTLVPAFDRDQRKHAPRRYAAPAGVALYATPHDVARFAEALSRESARPMFVPQNATGGSWGLGPTLYGGGVVGHDGGSVPAWGAVLRVNPATGNAFILLVSGARISASLLGDTWIRWETGYVRPWARRQMIYDRARPASIAMIAGAIVIVIARWRRRQAGRA